VFDEADALSGAGSEVDNSRHRYANLEVNYLLARTGPRVARSSDLKAVLMRVVAREPGEQALGEAFRAHARMKNTSSGCSTPRHEQDGEDDQSKAAAHRNRLLKQRADAVDECSDPIRQEGVGDDDRRHDDPEDDRILGHRLSVISPEAGANAVEPARDSHIRRDRPASVRPVCLVLGIRPR